MRNACRAMLPAAALVGLKPLDYYANGNDVDTVIVNGRVLMEKRQVKTVSEADALELSQKGTEDALNRTSLRRLLAIPDRFWGVSKGLPH